MAIALLCPWFIEDAPMKVFGASLTAISCLLLASLWSGAARADSVSDAIEVCSGCHGEKGEPTEKNIPNIWGQNRNYILEQLHDFKVGRRKNEIMSGIVESLSWDDMVGLAAHFSQQTWPTLKADAPSADVEKTALEVLREHDCEGCHHREYQGDMWRPRISGQQAEYLVKTMQDFRSHERKNYVVMSSVLRDVTDDEMKAVAAYLASKTVAKGAKE
jgi:cytochrome c553